MAEDPDQIKNHIDRTRRELDGNLHELESRVKEATHWRTYVNKYPLRILAAAVAGGAVISLLMGPSHARNRSQRTYAKDTSHGSDRESMTSDSSSFEPRGAHYQRHRAADIWDNIKGAMIGLATAQIKEFLVDAIPGFRRHYDHTERYKTTPPIATSIH